MKLIKATNLKEGKVIYFEYEHNYNHKSRAIRYKRGLFLGMDNHFKAIVILQSLHGLTWNNCVTICEQERLFEEEL